MTLLPKFRVNSLAQVLGLNDECGSIHCCIMLSTLMHTPKRVSECVCVCVYVYIKQVYIWASLVAACTLHNLVYCILLGAVITTSSIAKHRAWEATSTADRELLRVAHNITSTYPRKTTQVWALFKSTRYQSTPVCSLHVQVWLLQAYGVSMCQLHNIRLRPVQQVLWPSCIWACRACCGVLLSVSGLRLSDRNSYCAPLDVTS